MEGLLWLWAFILAHWLDILVVVVVIVGLVLLYRKGYKKQVTWLLRRLVAKAEQDFGSKTGAIKFSAVYSALPWLVRFLFTEDELRTQIELALVWLNGKLKETGGDLLALKDEQLLFDPGGMFDEDEIVD